MLNTKQSAALKELEAAFKKCKSAKLAFFGMDGSLLAFDAPWIDEKMLCPTTADIGGLQASEPDFVEHYETVNHHRTYRDSGGF